jgi:predicted amidohydrolase YtcJ
MWADLTVFDRDLTRLPPDEWLEAEVEMTIIGGEIVYRKS